MKTITIQGRSHKSEIIVGEQLRNLPAYLPSGRQCILITDATVRRLYGHLFPKAPVIEIGQGETVKNLQTVISIYEQLIDAGADRSSFLVGIGGGIVCDITGYAASTYMRGIGFGFAASTLLAQVDASVGGKNGVNFQGFKNMIGVFNQPEFVICDPDLLTTLPKQEVTCGFAEIIKHAAIADAGQFAFLETHPEKALALTPDVMTYLIHESVTIKSEVVNQDETEKGRRRILNFGHTFGHALEKTRALPHGEAVAIGMIIAAELSVQEGLLSASDAGRIRNLVETYNQPRRINIKPAELLEALKKDKKKAGDTIRFVLLDAIGSATERDMHPEDLAHAIAYLRGNATSL